MSNSNETPTPRKPSHRLSLTLIGASAILLAGLAYSAWHRGILVTASPTVTSPQNARVQQSPRSSWRLTPAEQKAQAARYFGVDPSELVESPLDSRVRGGTSVTRYTLRSPTRYGLSEANVVFVEPTRPGIVDDMTISWRYVTDGRRRLPPAGLAEAARCVLKEWGGDPNAMSALNPTDEAGSKYGCSTTTRANGIATVHDLLIDQFGRPESYIRCSYTYVPVLRPSHVQVTRSQAEGQIRGAAPSYGVTVTSIEFQDLRCSTKRPNGAYYIFRVSGTFMTGGYRAKTGDFWHVNANTGEVDAPFKKRP